MKFTCTVTINKPIHEVVKLWKNEDNFKHWQDGFQSIELLEGKKGEVGSINQIILEQGKNKMHLTESILINNLPEERKSFVHHKHMDNTQTVRFEEIEGGKTKYISEIEYTEIRHFMPKIMAKLFPSVFKKQVQKWSDLFKAFAESDSNKV